MSRLKGSTGSIVIAGHNVDFNSFDITFSQPTEEDTNYETAGNYSSNVGSGIVTAAGTATGFLRYNEADSDPNVDELDADGAAGTITLAAGTSYAGDFLVRDASIRGAKTAPTVGVSFSFVNASGLTKLWDETA